MEWVYNDLIKSANSWVISVLVWLFCVCIWRESNLRSPGLGPCKRNVPLGTRNLGYFKPDFLLNGKRSRRTNQEKKEHHCLIETMSPTGWASSSYVSTKTFFSQRRTSKVGSKNFWRTVSFGWNGPAGDNHLWRWITFPGKFPAVPKSFIFIPTEISGNFSVMENSQELLSNPFWNLFMLSLLSS